MQEPLVSAKEGNDSVSVREEKLGQGVQLHSRQNKSMEPQKKCKERSKSIELNKNSILIPYDVAPRTISQRGKILLSQKMNYTIDYK